MRKLKNWTVIMKSIRHQSDNLKGLVNLYEYIYDIKNQHPNHNKDFHEVIGFEQNHKTIMNNFATLQQTMDINHSLKSGKRASGRKASYGSSILLSLPSDIKLKEDDYKKIRDLVVLKLVDYIGKQYNLNYGKNEIIKYVSNHILSTAHLQNNNNHINILVPNVFIDYKTNNLVRVNLGKRNISYFIKQSFNQIMIKHFNQNFLDYKIKSHKKTKKLNSQYSYKLQKVEQQQEDLKTKIKNLSSLFDNTNAEIEKLNKRISIYLNRMDTSIVENDKDKFDKNKILVDKNILKIKEALKSVETHNDTKIDLTPLESIKKALNDKSQHIFNNYPTPQR